MTDIVERLLDERTDGALFLRREAATEITELRRMMGLVVEQFQLLEKLASHERIYEINRETGKRERWSLSKVIKAECKAAIDTFSRHAARQGDSDAR